MSIEFIFDTTTTNKEQHEGTTVPFLSRNITTQNGVLNGTNHRTEGPFTKGASARQNDVKIFIGLALFETGFKLWFQDCRKIFYLLPQDSKKNTN